MIEVLYLTALYVLGVLTASALFKMLPWTLVAWTGFLWGAFIWTLGGAFCLMLDLAFNLLTMAVWCGVIALIAIGFHLRYRRELTQLTSVLPIALSFVVVIALAGALRFGYVSFDSIAQLVIAQSLAGDAITETIRQQFGSWGVMLPALHGAAFWSGDAAYTTIQVGFLWSIIGTLGYVSHRATGNVRYWLPVLILAALTYFVVFQAAYIHNSIMASAYLLPAVALLWFAHVEDTPEFLYPALILFTGFAFTRTESVMFVALFVVLAVSYGRFPARTWWLALLPYGVLTLLWQLWLLLFVQPDTEILTPERILILIVAIIGTGLTPIVFWLTPLRVRLRGVLLGALGVALFGLLVLDPEHMTFSIVNSISNLWLGGLEWWGLTWYFVALSILIVRRAPHLQYGQLLSYGIIAFFLLLMLISIARTPYRLGWGDSANRIFTHILPLALFYVTLRIHAFLRPR